MIKDNITFTEMKLCIDEAVELCFENGVYQPYMKDFAIWHRIIGYFTDMIAPGADIDTIYSIILNEELRDTLMKITQAKVIHRAILDAIDIRCQKEIHRTKLNALIDDLLTKLDNPETLEMLMKWAEELGVTEYGQENND